MRLDKQLGIPMLWKPVPYAIAPVRVGQRLYYAFGLTRERATGIGLLTILSLGMIALTVYVLKSQGSISYTGAQSSIALLIFLTILCVGSTVWLVIVFGRRSQIYVPLDSGTAQIQYSYKLDSEFSSASILVQESQLQYGKSSRPGTGNLILKIFESMELRSVFLVVITIESDFEVVGAFKSIDAAFDFAGIIQAETGLEVVDRVLDELQFVSGNRAHGFGSSDKRALRKRHRSKPFAVKP